MSHHSCSVAHMLLCERHSSAGCLHICMNYWQKCYLQNLGKRHFSSKKLMKEFWLDFVSLAIRHIWRIKQRIGGHKTMKLWGGACWAPKQGVPTVCALLLKTLKWIMMPLHSFELHPVEPVNSHSSLKVSAAIKTIVAMFFVECLK